MATFKDRINTLFDEAKDKNYRITQKEFAQIFGASRSQLQGWLVGAGEPDSELMKIIAEKSNVSVSWLTGESDVRVLSDGLLEKEWPDVVNVLRRNGKKPSPEEQKRIARIIRASLEEDDE